MLVCCLHQTKAEIDDMLDDLIPQGMQTAEDDSLARLAIRGGLSPDEYIATLRQQLKTAELTTEQLREFVRIKREHLAAFGSLKPAGAASDKPKKAKAGKQPAISTGDLLSELDGL